MIGKILGGRYEIISKLGQGAFGTTFLAIDRQMPEKDQCVVKHFSPQAADPYTLQEARRLFDTEAIVLNRLGIHNQIPRLLAHIEEEQEFYLVQEFIAGHDLSHEINSGKQLSQDEVIALLRDILKVLEFVHQHNVIHRDIKPSNLMRRDQDGKIVLIDFGAVKQISSQAVNVQGLTTLTVAIGTAGYMPSEQSQGQPRLCSDIYAVGIVGIQALTGLRANQLPKDHSTGEIVWRNQAQVSQKLAEVLEKMVCYDFRQRYQSATEVLQALQGFTTNSSPKSIPWKALIGVVIAVVATVILMLPRIMKPSNSLLLYEDSTFGTRIKYPQLWKKEEKPDPVAGSSVTFLSPEEGNSGMYQSSFSLSVDKNIPGKAATLDEYTKEIKQSNRDVVILQEGKTKLANRPAYQIVYAKQESGYSFKLLQIWTVKDNKAYIITYQAESNKYSDSLKIVQEMINSFEIK